MSGSNLIQKDVAEFVNKTHALTPSLLLSKYAQVGKIEVKDHKGKWINKPLRTEAVKAVCKATGLSPKAPPVWSRRPDAHVLYMTLKTRLMINMAGGVIENGNLNLHPFTSQPYIPGSAVKGVTRHAAWRMWKEESVASTKKALALCVAEVFGFPTGDKKLDEYLTDHFPEFTRETHLAGSIVFLDAHPLENAKLEEEILTPHTRENPVPNVFPCVAAGPTFVFALLPGRRLSSFPPEKREQLWTLAQSWVREALTEDGIGAKTSAGYGWFEENPEITQRLENEARLNRESAEKEHAEAKRMAAMSPEDRFIEEFQTMGPEPFAHATKEIDTYEPERQKALLRVVASKDKKDWWKGKKKRSAKDPKDKAMVDLLLKLASAHGVELS